MSDSLPLNETPKGNVRPTGSPCCRLALALLVLAHAAFAAWLNPFGMARTQVGETRLPLALGILFSMAASNLVHTTPSPYRDIFPPLLILGLGSRLSALVTTVVIRFCGFRMVREPRVLEPTQVSIG